MEGNREGRNTDAGGVGRLEGLALNTLNQFIAFSSLVRTFFSFEYHNKVCQAHFPLIDIPRSQQYLRGQCLQVSRVFQVDRYRERQKP